MGTTRGIVWGDIAVLLLLLSEGSLGLYFPQRMYTESIYVGQPQGSPVLQVHSMLESSTERPYFYLCSHRDTYASWFHMDEASGILSMNKTLEWSDFSSIIRSLGRSDKDLNLKVGVSSVPLQKVMCLFLPTVEVRLTFINDTAPSCGQVELSTLCYPERVSNPHITENRMPGALRLLHRYTHASICPNYTISYGVVADSPVPFAVDGSTSELVVTAPVDREEKEVYHLDIVCMVRTEDELQKFFSSLHVNVFDEDDNPPYVNGTDSEDVIIEFNRSEGTVYGTLIVYDRDTTPVYPTNQIQNKLVGTLMTNDSWIRNTFTIEHKFREEKAIFGNIRGTVHEYKLKLSQNLSVMEQRSFQLDYLVNDTTFPGPEGTVLLHFNVTILPVPIRFSNITYLFTVSKKATTYSQIGNVCVDNCLKFKGIDVTYQIEIADRNISADDQSCYMAVGIAQNPKEKTGVLYVNDTEVLRRSECQVLQYAVIAQEEQSKFQAKTQLLIIFEGEGKVKSSQDYVHEYRA